MIELSHPQDEHPSCEKSIAVNWKIQTRVVPIILLITRLSPDSQRMGADSRLHLASVIELGLIQIMDTRTFQSPRNRNTV